MQGIYESHSESETAEVARRLAGELPRRSAVLLYGDLGAGKTAFVRGLVAGAGGEPDDVSSPTFVLMQEYGGDRRVDHVDLYRLREPEVEDFADELADRLAGDGIVAIEWADRLTWPIEGAVHVRIDDLGGDARRIRIDGPGPGPGQRAAR
ncbi:MAG: tRNA (adenosine(37)-N6)-threonylcarbamoyltransferase complex ATPase subunit type 1 TsaE [Acidobacteria bacterium]|nr:tRNA (adenosine(37)-N6)-threonylcarbamoyltransferase complex ATPase subunit type 1 TsaE [Acidobacteriota bacterium]